MHEIYIVIIRNLYNFCIILASIKYILIRFISVIDYAYYLNFELVI